MQKPPLAEKADELTAAFEAYLDQVWPLWKQHREDSQVGKLRGAFMAGARTGVELLLEAQG